MQQLTRARVQFFICSKVENVVLSLHFSQAACGAVVTCGGGRRAHQGKKDLGVYQNASPQVVLECFERLRMQHPL